MADNAEVSESRWKKWKNFLLSPAGFFTAFAAVAGFIWFAYDIVIRSVAPSAKPVAYVETHKFAIPSGFRGDVDRFVENQVEQKTNVILEKTNKADKTDNEPKSNQATQLEPKVSIWFRDPLDKYKFVQSVWVIRVKNEGYKDARNVRLSLPGLQLAEILREGQTEVEIIDVPKHPDREWGGAVKPDDFHKLKDTKSVTVGTLKAQEQVVLNVWTSANERFWLIKEEIRVNHDDGLGKVVRVANVNDPEFRWNSVRIPLWVVLVILALNPIVYGIGNLGKHLSIKYGRSRRLSEPSRPEYSLKFRRMFKFDVIWEWDWFETGGSWEPIRDGIRPICPRCGRTMLFQKESVEDSGVVIELNVYAECQERTCQFRHEFYKLNVQWTERTGVSRKTEIGAFDNEHEIRLAVYRDIKHVAESGLWKAHQNSLRFPPPSQEIAVSESD